MRADREAASPPVQNTTIRSRLFNVFELTLLFAVSAVGAITAVTTVLTVSDFEGDCPLFAGVEYTNRVFFRIDVNPSSFLCDFCIVVQVFLSMAAIFIIMLRIVMICSGLIKQSFQYKIRIFFMIPFCAMASFTVLVQATISTAGLNYFCRGLLDGAVDQMRCWMFQPIEWIVYDGYHFYNRLFKAMIASWASFLIWSILTTASCLVALFSTRGST